MSRETPPNTSPTTPDPNIAPGLPRGGVGVLGDPGDPNQQNTSPNQGLMSIDDMLANLPLTGIKAIMKAHSKSLPGGAESTPISDEAAAAQGKLDNMPASQYYDEKMRGHEPKVVSPIPLSAPRRTRRQQKAQLKALRRAENKRQANLPTPTNEDDISTNAVAVNRILTVETPALGDSYEKNEVFARRPGYFSAAQQREAMIYGRFGMPFELGARTFGLPSTSMPDQKRELTPEDFVNDERREKKRRDNRVVKRVGRFALRVNPLSEANRAARKEANTPPPEAPGTDEPTVLRIGVSPGLDARAARLPYTAMPDQKRELTSEDFANTDPRERGRAARKEAKRAKIRSKHNPASDVIKIGDWKDEDEE